MSSDKKSKPNEYYNNPRDDMLQYIPANIRCTLEFGCGCGNFSGLVKKKFNTETWGVEIEVKAANEAMQVLDHVINSDAHEAIDQLPDHHFDCIIFFDILEHLVDPYTLLTQIKKKLKSNGVVISSIPNIRYYSALKKYVLKGDWDYTDHGILDRTHLRFFTYKSIVKLFENLDYEIVSIEGIHPTNSRIYKLINLLTLNTFNDVRYKHFAVVAKPSQAAK